MKDLLRAVRFAAERHAGQQRKNAAASPYILHPIEVAEWLANVAGVDDERLLSAALLHDVLEDTATTPEEIAARFGPDVLALVLECTDDMSRPRPERKRMQVVGAPQLSPRAKMIKLADKIVNLMSLLNDPPPGWSAARRRAYANWAGRVIAAMGSVHPDLDREARRVLSLCRKGWSPRPVRIRRQRPDRRPSDETAVLHAPM